MRELRELLKSSFDLWVKKRWIKTIEKQTDKCNKLSKKLLRQKYVLNTLLDDYLKIYGENLRPPEQGGAE